VKIKRLYIGEMGIYRNALMENINSNIVVVGGLNRAGKTTLLETLRHMAYGFPKNIRASVAEYDVESDLIDEESNQYTLRVSGQKEPEITSGKMDKAIKTKTLYGNIDKFTYSQLYTVTLEELKKSNVKGEEEKLQAVLLGAGLKDIVHMPKLAEDFRKEKEKIGGKQGNPNTKAFKNSYDRLLKASDERDKALKQLEEYEAKCFQLEYTEKNIQSCESELQDINKKVAAFEVLKTYYHSYEEKNNLELQLEKVGSFDENSITDNLPSLERIEALKEEYKLITQQYEKAKDSFSENVSQNTDIYKLLMENKDRIKEAQRQLSGLKERLENYKAMKDSYEREKEQVLLSMEALNGSWKGDFVKVINLDCDTIEQDTLYNITEGIRQEEENKRLDEKELELFKVQREALNKEENTMKQADASFYIGKYLYIPIAILLAGAVLFFFNKTLGGAVALAGVTSTFLYLLIKYEGSKQSFRGDKDLVLQINILDGKIAVQENRIEAIQKNIKELNDQLEDFKAKLNIKSHISHGGLIQYFRAASELKGRIINLGYSGKKLAKLQSEINSELIEINEMASKFIEGEIDFNLEPYRASERIFNKLGVIFTWLQYGDALYKAVSKLEEVEGRIRTLLNLSEGVVLYYEVDKIIEGLIAYNEYHAIKQRLEAIDSHMEKLLDSERISTAVNFLCSSLNLTFDSRLMSLYNLFEYYSAEEEINRGYMKNNDRLNETTVQLDNLKEERRVLKDSLKALSTSDKLEEAQSEIDEARADLKQQAVKYSIYAAAEYILDSVQKNFINTAKDTILGGAGVIFNKITHGEYKALLPGDNLLQTDFKAMNEKGDIQSSTSILSRGTGEQLFLSVRISRIKDLNPKLPVILDDPFVNFDSIHTRNTLKVIAELSKENQVFILTCHPELVKLIGSISREVQYWKLSKGKFELSDKDRLIEYLQ
jgi:uncharacterized protein YhaN